MISNLFNTIVYEPLYNGLILLIDVLPWADAGIAVVIFTIIVKLILFPLSRKSIHTQLALKQIQPEMEKIKEKHKDDRQKQAQEMMDLYRNAGVNPFSGFFLILIQLPIIIALYWIFLQSGLPEVNSDILYSFVSTPDIDMNFLGMINIAEKSALLAFLAAVATYYQLKLAMPPQKKDDKKIGENSFKDDLAKSMQIQMRYVFPVIIFIVAYTISGAVALYWLTSNLFQIGQEIYIRKEYYGKNPNNEEGEAETKAIEGSTSEKR